MLYDKRWDNTLDTPARILLDAADYIEKHGWVQETLRDIDGRVCLLGALISVAGSGDVWHRARVLLADYLRPHGVPAWNDNFCCSKQQAIDTLIGAAGAP